MSVRASILDGMLEGMGDLLASATGCYDAKRASALAGVPKSTLYDWARKGVVVPSISPVQEKLWSFQDLLTLRAVHWLRKRKSQIPASPMAQVRAALEQTIRAGASPWVDASVQILIDRSGKVFVRRSGVDVADVHGQAVISDEIDLLGVFEDSPSLVRPTDHIVIAPSTLAGEPHLAGTRIGTLGLAALAEEGYDSRQIASLYQLPEEQVQEAIGYEERLAA